MILLVLYGVKSKLIVYQIVHISFNIVSILNYLLAFYPISTQTSECCNNPIFRHSWKLKPSTSGLTSKPTESEIAFQCLYFIPFFLKATIKGRLGLNFYNYCFTFYETATIWCKALSLNRRLIPAIDLEDYSTNLSIPSASSSSKGWVIQRSIPLYHLFVIVQSVL